MVSQVPYYNCVRIFNHHHLKLEPWSHKVYLEPIENKAIWVTNIGPNVLEHCLLSQCGLLRIHNASRT